MKVYCYTSPYTDGWKNLALDEVLLETLPEDVCMLYFYVNDNAVIIGRNQNGWKECHLGRMKEDGVQLVRRMSGGGAVYHDQGNLNFSFHMPKSMANTQRQLQVILDALTALGIAAQFTGRNDITLADGRKCSGNAFCQRGGRVLHHGTLLVDANLTKLGQYLNVSQDKMKGKGVASVAARVCNLKELEPTLTVDAVKEKVVQAFHQQYGPYQWWTIPKEGEAMVEALYQRNRTWAWQLGKGAPFSWEGETRFPWGGITLDLNVTAGMVAEISLHTDALDVELPKKVEALLQGKPFDFEELAQALQQSQEPALQDIARWLQGQNN